MMMCSLNVFIKNFLRTLRVLHFLEAPSASLQESLAISLSSFALLRCHSEASCSGKVPAVFSWLHHSVLRFKFYKILIGVILSDLRSAKDIYTRLEFCSTVLPVVQIAEPNRFAAAPSVNQPRLFRLRKSSSV